MLRIAKVNVISLVPHDCSPCVSGPHSLGAILISACAAWRSCVSFFVGLLRPSTDMVGELVSLANTRSAC